MVHFVGLLFHITCIVFLHLNSSTLLSGCFTCFCKLNHFQACWIYTLHCGASCYPSLKTNSYEHLMVKSHHMPILASGSKLSIATHNKSDICRSICNITRRFSAKFRIPPLCDPWVSQWGWLSKTTIFDLGLTQCQFYDAKNQDTARGCENS
jgi:hypothetical protein